MRKLKIKIYRVLITDYDVRIHRPKRLSTHFVSFEARVNGDLLTTEVFDIFPAMLKDLYEHANTQFTKMIEEINDKAKS